MNKFLKMLKENKLLLDAANVALGIVMVAALIFVVALRSNIALLIAIWAAGLINAVNGLKAMRHKGQKTMGQSMLFMGFIIVVLGTALVLSMMGKGVE